MPKTNFLSSSIIIHTSVTSFSFVDQLTDVDKPRNLAKSVTVE